ncbi:MAG: tRNA (adenosine(37)-N6)-threonylcarbamoyltransferase complex dimerization subunit type 1 TsaB [Propionibacteriaceae bacterium]|jgi:tRNA threonylcarbamoyl adenosine modification protein YeaZ|nr:tRNA (adenosine(37)-N6)-threonylcarbamoyltransferase complex dimerization subunit type 1 TsaB [Propionibacteriaceae bacterium]
MFTDLTLGIDTSTSVCIGAALGTIEVIGKTVGDTRSHAELLMNAIDTALQVTGTGYGQIKRIGVGVGPGPYTGLRVGIATARTLAFTLGVPVKGVCSLDVLALQFASISCAQPFIVATDARRKELYWAQYSPEGARVEGPFVSAPEEVTHGFTVVGPGGVLYKDVFAGRIAGDQVELDAGFLASRLDALPDTGLEPLYLREPDAQPAVTRKSTLTGGPLKLPASFEGYDK